VPPPAYFVISAVFHYLGPAFAVLLFVRVDVLGVAWLRIVFAAVVFAVWRRPWRIWRRLDERIRRILLGWATLFALYIVLGHRVAESEQVRGIDGLALAMLIAAVVALPIGIWDATPAAIDAVALLAAIGVGVSSSVIPYVCDQLAMARLRRATYALMMALLPATATVVGIVVLTQIPTPVEVTGVALVIVGVTAGSRPVS